jgi:hypothetical protein
MKTQKETVIACFNMFMNMCLRDWEEHQKKTLHGQYLDNTGSKKQEC